MKTYLGIDVGSVSTNLALLNAEKQVLSSAYLRTMGQPIQMLTKGLKLIREQMQPDWEVAAVGATGSARRLAGVVAGADVVKNEITAHAVAAICQVPGVQTVLEIGGQDSKIMIIRDDIVVDFAMNTVCAAGTGSFLDQQAARLGIPIEEFGDLALRANVPVRIAGRCAVFAESDMIHKQQLGYAMEDIVAGLCEALVRNYLNNVGKGKEILPPVVFQGGVAANAGIRAAFSRALQTEVIVPDRFDVMGAIGAAILAQEAEAVPGFTTRFRGFAVDNPDFRPSSFECRGCANRCEVIQICFQERIVARWGDRCGKWEHTVTREVNQAGEKDAAAPEPARAREPDAAHA